MKFNSLILVILLSVCAKISTAQNSTISPYSRFGPGDLLFNGFASQRGMGGTGIAGVFPGKFNGLNPAAYAGDSLMVLEFGMMGEVFSHRQGDAKSTGSNARLDAFCIGLPLVKNKAGIAFGYLPFSGTGYRLQSLQTLDSTNSLTTEYEGTGGYNRYFISTGVHILKNLSVGLNASYFFGTTERKRTAFFSDEDFFDTRLIENTTYGDFLFEGSMLYSTYIKPDLRLSWGVTVGLPNGINARRSLLWSNFRENNFGIQFTRDTVQYIESERGTMQMPLSLGTGIQISKNDKLVIMTDFRFQKWSDYRSFGEKDSLGNSFRLAAGAQFCQDPKATKYFKKMQYRAGLYYGRSHLLIRNTPVNDMGITIGAGLPLRKAFQSQLSFALEVGQRGTTAENLIRENYFRLLVGLTFNEGWFQKRRYE